MKPTGNGSTNSALVIIGIVVGFSFCSGYLVGFLLKDVVSDC